MSWVRLSVYICGLIAAPIPAQTPELLRDINQRPTAPLGSAPADLAASGSRVYLAANDGRLGAELFSTTGTPGSTRLIADIWPGQTGSAPAEFVAVGRWTCFTADDGVHGREPWVTDGTNAGTRLAADLLPGASSSEPGLLTEFAGALFVRAGAVVYRVDLTAGGAQTVLAPTSFARAMIVHGGALWILADSLRGFAGVELYRSDGTPAGTQRMATVASEVGTSMLASFGGDLWFRTASGPLYRTDGTQAGTVRALDLGFDNGFGSDLLVTPIGLVVTGIDRSAAPTPRLLVNRGSGFVNLPLSAGASVVHSLIPDGQRLFFVVAGAQFGLFVSDGTPAGTALVRSLPGPIGDPGTRVSLGGRVAFAFGANGDRELWTSDGTAAGTRVLRGTELAPGGRPTSLTVLPSGGAAVFAAETFGRGRELLRTDGTDAGTALVDDLAFIAVTASSAPTRFTTLGAKTLFSADDGVHGRELWSTDLVSGANLVSDILAGFGSSQPEELASDGRLVWFSADDGVSGRELWVSDGTAAGTRQVADIATGTESATPLWIAPLREGAVVFAARTAATGHELWGSDGTASGTRMLFELRPGSVGANPNRLMPFGNRVLFAADDGVNGESVWSTDGTAAGTVRLPLAAVFGTPIGLAALRGRAIFVARDALGNGVWSTDGTSAGTQLLARVVVTNRPYTLIGTADVAVSNGVLFFAGSNPVAGLEPWVSDGTAAGTRMLADLAPGPDSFGPGLFVALDDRVLFASYQGVWRTAGTAASTVLVDSRPTAIHDMVATGNRVAWFANVDRRGERSLWRTDGSSTNTSRIDARLDNIYGQHLAPASGRLLATLADPEFGAELFAVAAGATVRPLGFACGTAARGRVSATDPVLGAPLRLRGGDFGASVGAVLLGEPAHALQLLPGTTCAIYADLLAPTLLLPIALSAGRFDIGFTVPDVASLLGSRVITQSVLATGAGPIGLETASALELTMGR